MPAVRVLCREIADDGRSAALIIAERGEPVCAWGAVDHPVGTASIRKSVLSALYGILVGRGEIDLDATLDACGIDDMTPLTATERQARIRHLLCARSGIYLPSVYDTATGRPARGSHLPGTFWFYNNWDFNVLGTVFERAAGMSIFEAIARWLAAPLGMQDYVPTDGRYIGGPHSCHPVYKLRMSARDLARFGELYRRMGEVAGEQIVPKAWVRESTRAYSHLGGGRGYGMLWWTAEADAPGDPLSLPVPIFYASGYGGQYVIVVPAWSVVIVHVCGDLDAGISHAEMGTVLRRIAAARSA